MQALNAHLNFTKLGVVAEEYHRNVYGESTSVLHKGTPTDRLVAQWWIRRPHVERRVRRRRRPRRCEPPISPAPSPVNVTRPAEQWLANADLLLARDERRLVLEIPMGFTDMQREAPELALEWRLQTREIFETYFARGYRVGGFLPRSAARSAAATCSPRPPMRAGLGRNNTPAAGARPQPGMEFVARRRALRAAGIWPRAPGFTAAAVGVLALGIGLNAGMFSLVYAIGFAGRAYADPDRVVQLYSSRTSDPDSYRAFSFPAYQQLASTDGFSGVLAHTPALVGVSEGGESRRTFGVLVSRNYFDVLGVPVAIGRGFTEEESRPGQDAPVVVVTWAFWQRHRLDPALVGSTVRVNERPFTVVGITPRGFTGTMSVFGPELFFPLGVFHTIANDFDSTTARPARAGRRLPPVPGRPPGARDVAAGRAGPAVASRRGADEGDAGGVSRRPGHAGAAAAFRHQHVADGRGGRRRCSAP